MDEEPQLTTYSVGVWESTFAVEALCVDYDGFGSTAEVVVEGCVQQKTIGSQGGYLPLHPGKLTFSFFQKWRFGSDNFPFQLGAF